MNTTVGYLSFSAFFFFMLLAGGLFGGCSPAQDSSSATVLFQAQHSTTPARSTPKRMTHVSTVFKAAPADCATFDPSQCCLVPSMWLIEGTYLGEDAEYYHYRFEPQNRPSGCLISEGYLKKSALSEAVPTKPHLPIVMMYHEIAEDLAHAVSGDDVDQYSFETQMQWLLDQGYKTLSIEDLYKIKAKVGYAPKKSVVVTFDDGYLGDYTYAINILKKLKIRATFFVHTNYVGVAWGASHHHMTWDMLREIDAQALFSVQSHTVNHKSLAVLADTNQAELIYELEESRKKLEAELNRGEEENTGNTNDIAAPNNPNIDDTGLDNPDSEDTDNQNIRGEIGARDILAYPYGAYNQQVIAAMKKTFGNTQGPIYRMGIAVGDKIKADPLYTIPRIGVGKWSNNFSVFKSTFNNYLK